MEKIRRIAVWYYLLNKRLLKKRSFLILLLLVPLLVFGMRIVSKQDSGVLTILLCSSETSDDLPKEVVDKLGLSGCSRDLCQTLVSCEHIDQRRLAHVTAADEGHIAQGIFRDLRDLLGATLENGFFYHKSLKFRKNGLRLLGHQLENDASVVVALAQVVDGVVALVSLGDLGNDDTLLHQQTTADELTLDGEFLVFVLGADLTDAIVALGVETLQADDSVGHAKGIEQAINHHHSLRFVGLNVVECRILA